MALDYVDVSDIHLRDIKFLVTRADGQVVDFSSLVSEFSWSDSVNTAGMEVTIVAQGIVSDILQIGGEGSSARVLAPLVDLNTGTQTLQWLWHGTFDEVVDNRSDGMIERTITGFDIAQRFATSEEDYVFTNSSLSTILNRVLSDFGVPAGTITTTGKTLGQIVSRGRTLWDLLQEAVQRHADQTGEVYRIYADEERINMKLQGDQDKWWIFEYGESFQDFRRTRTVRDMINHVKIYGVFEGDTDKPAVEATRANETSKSLYGLRQKVEYIGSAEDESRVIDLAEKTLARYGAPDEQVEITGWLIPNLRAGEQIRFIDDEMGLNRLYYVETLDATWSPDRAETIATVRREAVDPDLILEEVTVA